LHRFRDIAFNVSNVAIFGYPLAFNPCWRGSPGTISVKFCMVTADGLGTDREMTDGFAIANKGT